MSLGRSSQEKEPPKKTMSSYDKSDTFRKVLYALQAYQDHNRDGGSKSWGHDGSESSSWDHDRWSHKNWSHSIDNDNDEASEQKNYCHSCKSYHSEEIEEPESTQEEFHPRSYNLDPTESSAESTMSLSELHPSDWKSILENHYHRKSYGHDTYGHDTYGHDTYGDDTYEQHSYDHDQDEDHQLTDHVLMWHPSSDSHYRRRKY